MGTRSIPEQSISMASPARSETPLRSARRARGPSPKLAILAGAVIAAIFLWFTRAGLSAYFTGDDLMNLFKAWQLPYYRILLDNLLCFTSAYRPMGTLVYRLLFSVAGLNPLPFRIFVHLLLLGNLYLLYRTAAAISSRQAGILCALFGSYSAGFIDLYYNTGTIYDILCFTFYLLALDVYVRARRHGAYLAPRALAGFLICYICALNSKEMAVTLPVVLVIYELTLGRRGPFLRRWGPPILSAALTLPYVIAKFTSSSPLMGNAEYKLHLGMRAYLRGAGHYAELLASLQPGTMDIRASATLIVASLAIALAASARRRLLFAWLFSLVTVLPVIFISHRGGYAMYIPSFGVALYLAVLIVDARKMLEKRIAAPRRALSADARRVFAVDTFLFCLIGLLFFHSAHPLPPFSPFDNMVRTLANQIRVVQPAVRPDWKVLILEDPFDAVDYAPIFALRLVYHAQDLLIHRPKMMNEAERPKPEDYDLVLTFDGKNLLRLKP